MPKHILIATDGSEFALKAAGYALDLAKSLGARTTAFTVTPTWDAIALSEIARGRFEDEYAARAKAYGDACLSKVTALAKTLGVACDGVQATSDRADRAILDQAAASGADLIVMGAHGRRGMESVILGSQTVKVLTQSKVPVLVYRE